ncbi:MAG: hypothetical protein OXC68_03965 [Aestuariivita sp.]|nr:hypothetical protein [Aestuariivita sp.]
MDDNALLQADGHLNEVVLRKENFASEGASPSQKDIHDLEKTIAASTILLYSILFDITKQIAQLTETKL